MSLTYGSLQVFPWKNDTIIEKMDGRKWCRHITDFFQYMYAWNQGGIIISVYDISLLQFLFCKNTVLFFIIFDMSTRSSLFWQNKFFQFFNTDLDHVLVTIGGCLFNKLLSNFLLHLSFHWRTFFRRITAHWSIKYGLIRTREITDIRLLDELYARISKFSIRVYVNTSKQCFPFSLTIWNLQPLTNTLRFFYLSLKFLKIKICQ